MHSERRRRFHVTRARLCHEGPARAGTPTAPSGLVQQILGTDDVADVVAVAEIVEPAAEVDSWA